MNLAQVLNSAIALHQAGRLAEAETRYRQILARDPKHADALHLLGVVAYQGGKPENAIPLIRQAIRLQPGVAIFHNNLGQALESARNIDEAEKHYRKAIALKSNYAEAHNNLGNILRSSGNLEGAKHCYERALQLNPNYAEAHSNLGNIIQDLGSPTDAIHHYKTALRLNGRAPKIWANLGSALHAAHQIEEAVSCYRRAVEIDPQQVDALNDLAMLLRKSGKLSEAAALLRQASRIAPENVEVLNNLGLTYRDMDDIGNAAEALSAALKLQPGFHKAHNSLGLLHKQCGRISEAIASFEAALRSKSDYCDALNNLGVMFIETDRSREAASLLEAAIKIDPKFVEAYVNLGSLLDRSRSPDRAIAACRSALAINPDSAGAHHNWANALKNQGHLDEAIFHYREAIRLNPAGVAAHSNLLLTLHYHPASTPQSLAAEHRIWREKHADPLGKASVRHANDRTSSRTIRVGYVSPDLRNHAVARFLLPLVQSHDRQRFELFFYANVTKPDFVTRKFQDVAAAWRNTIGMPDDAMADLIRTDRIDILVDLTAHTGDHKLLVFARKPAPIQITFLSYCSTTGLDTMDYRLSDPHLDPSDADQGHYTERTLRLPETYWCCCAPFSETIPAPSAASASRPITFGCLNNFCKVTEPTWAIWTKLLARIPNARLVVHAYEGSHREALWRRLEESGLDRTRLEFVGVQSIPAYLDTFNRIDVCLDPFPFGGGTTTCDALWMGVPVVTLPGQTAVSRAGRSLLTQVGLTDCIARDENDYIAIAERLARDEPRLSYLRENLRQIMQDSPLMDAPRFARSIETIYSETWRTWCEQ